MPTLDDVLKPSDVKVESTSGTSMQLHVSGDSSQWSYWTKFKAALKLMLGGDFHYSFCNAVQAVFSSDKERKYLGLDHAGSEAQIEVSLKPPHTKKASQHEIVTQIRVVKTENLTLQ